MKTTLLIITLSIMINPIFAEEDSYFEKLDSLIGRKKLNIKPKDRSVDINLVTVEEGGAGLKFGSSIDDLVRLWGKPSGVMVHKGLGTWRFHAGGCLFGFIENELVSITIHSATIPKAYMENGITFKSTIDDLKSVYKNLEEDRMNQFKYVTDNDYVVEFMFYPDRRSRQQRLSAITLHHPDSELY
jgi:hypothetical protein